jgi:protein AIR1/2
MPKTAFDSVNEKFFRSRSASISSDEDKAKNLGEEPSNGDKPVKSDQTPYFVDESEGSETGEVSEGGDSIMLNLGPRSGGTGLDVAQDDTPTDDHVPFQVDPLPVILGFVPINRPAVKPKKDLNEEMPDSGPEMSEHETNNKSKEEAFRVFSQTYSTPPAVLADLNHKDLKSQARYFFYDRSIHDLDLSKHIACTECLQEGHLAIICPTKEVRNAWVKYEGY